MNLPDSESEIDLRTLRPAAPSPELEMRIAHSLAVRDRTLTVSAPTTAVLQRCGGPWGDISGLLRGLGWATAGAAAALALSHRAEIEPRQIAPPLASTTTATAQPKSIESSAQLLAASEEGLRYDGENLPVRQVRYSLLERRAWVDPATGARMEFAVPREEVRLIPVTFQ